MIMISPILLTLLGNFFSLVGNEAKAEIKRRQAAEARAERATSRRTKEAIEKAERMAERLRKEREEKLAAEKKSAKVKKEIEDKIKSMRAPIDLNPYDGFSD